jgi:D-aminopeptidase
MILDSLPSRYPGPGGAAAIIRDGAVLEQRAWGWADVARRIPFTSQTLFPVCSITKQFTCALLLDQNPDPALLAKLLPGLEQRPTPLELAHNQSGLRDYWAAAMLCGATPERVFGPEHADRLFRSTRSLHFAPGTRFSYSNGNFRLLADLIEAHTGCPFAELLRERVLDPAGMPNALIAADTAALPGGAVGYEGTLTAGFTPAVNRIHWTGDAGLVASLEDMIAWEQFIDRTRDDPAGLYRRLSAPVTFRDGNPAQYGFGLRRMTVLGRAATGHGGGLRGWSSERVTIPEERLSVVVLFNHLSNAGAAAAGVLDTLLGAAAGTGAGEAAAAGWVGRYYEPETGLAAWLEPIGGDRLLLHYATRPETLTLADGVASGTTTTLRRGADVLAMERPSENLRTVLQPVTGEPAADIAGRFHNAELDAWLVIEAAGGVLYGAFEGWLGGGLMQVLLPAGPDLWRLPCPRALDYAPPGDWTVAVQRDDHGSPSGLVVGCWLARHVVFTRS